MDSYNKRSRAKSIMVEEELMVGFKDEAMTIKEQLAQGNKQLGIISIVGMPGLGKTTLAQNLYDDPYIMHLFNIRAWTSVSQSYRKRKLLLDILHSVVKLPDNINEIIDEKLGEEIYKRLKGKRYLIVMDDMWSTGAWDDVKLYLPNDRIGSKVMFTSRLMEVGLQAKPECCSHRLRFLTEEESWELLHKKVFGDKTFPPGLIKFGKQIAKKCEGLPLAIVVIAGFLAKEEPTRALWKQVAESVSSYIVSDHTQYLHTLALSYHHLPHHLKPCFLYFGTFLEGREIPVRRLIWLWIAERFIQPIEEKKFEDVADELFGVFEMEDIAEEEHLKDSSGEKELEDIADGYLTDLIERSLVIVVKKKANGGIKACRIHDLLHNLCLRKAEEFNFLAWITDYKHIPFSSNNEANNPLRLCIHTGSNSDLFSKKPCARGIESIFLFGGKKKGQAPCTKLPPLRGLGKARCGQAYPRNFCDYDSVNSYPSSSVMPFYSHNESLLDMCGDNMMKSYSATVTGVFQGFFCESFSHPSMLFSAFQNKSPSSVDHQKTFKPLRVLDIWCLKSLSAFFSFEISDLLRLRYLAIHTDDFDAVPPSIIDLSNLETLILGTRGSNIFLPENIWELVKLRHLYTKGKYHIGSERNEKSLCERRLHTPLLLKLQTISNLCPCGPVGHFLSSSPNLRKLGLHGYLISESGQLTVPDLDSLSHLETLKLDNTMLNRSINLLRIDFPANVKKLTLRGMAIKWEEMWILGVLHNLEVLKLERGACQGTQWVTKDGGFRRLKYLKLKFLGLKEWIASSTPFPRLQHFVLEGCFILKEIPSGLRDIPVLQIIEVNFCLPSAEESARKIKRWQERNGNSWLKILINNQECSGMNYDSSTDMESTGSASEDQRRQPF